MDVNKMNDKPIVVVDYDPATLELLRLLLESEGYTTICYPGWVASAAIIGQSQPALVLLELAPLHPSEVLMLLEQLRLEPATMNTPLIVTSTQPRLLERFSRSLARLGCIPMVKPFNMNDFFAIVGIHMQPAYARVMGSSIDSLAYGSHAAAIQKV